MVFVKKKLSLYMVSEMVNILDLFASFFKVMRKNKLLATSPWLNALTLFLTEGCVYEDIQFQCSPRNFKSSVFIC